MIVLFGFIFYNLAYVKGFMFPHLHSLGY